MSQAGPDNARCARAHARTHALRTQWWTFIVIHFSTLKDYVRKQQFGPCKTGARLACLVYILAVLVCSAFALFSYHEPLWSDNCRNYSSRQTFAKELSITNITCYGFTPRCNKYHKHFSRNYILDTKSSVLLFVCPCVRLIKFILIFYILLDCDNKE